MDIKKCDTVVSAAALRPRPPARVRRGAAVLFYFFSPKSFLAAVRPAARRQEETVAVAPIKPCSARISCCRAIARSIVSRSSAVIRTYAWASVSRSPFGRPGRRPIFGFGIISPSGSALHVHRGRLPGGVERDAEQVVGDRAIDRVVEHDA